MFTVHARLLDEYVYFSTTNSLDFVGDCLATYVRTTGRFQ